MKVETDIASIKENLIGGGVILVIVYVKTFKTGFIVFTGNIIICLSPHWPIIFIIKQTLSLGEIKGKNVKMTDTAGILLKIVLTVNTLNLFYPSRVQFGQISLHIYCVQNNKTLSAKIVNFCYP
jgi:hypothetical protein